MAEIKNNVLELDNVVKRLNTTLDENIKRLNAGATAVEVYNKKLTSVPSEFQKSLTEIKTKTDDITASKQKLDKVEQQAVLTAKQREQQSIKESNARNALNKQREREIAQNEKLNSAYLQLAKAEALAARNLQDLIARGKTADQTQKQYNQSLKQAQAQFDGLRAKLIMADSATQRFNRNVGNYPKLFAGMAGGLRQLMSAFGLVGGIFLFAQAIKGAFNTIKEFDKANADLAATMGKSRKEITALTNDQKRLGASTKFTATEVAGLQKEFAKLGFSQTEILNATEATLALAAAVDTDLANAAMVAGATLRGFGLDASEMGRVTDVMASSFTKSALDISNFSEAMKYVAPIAGQTGVSIEFATAMLGKLADSGVKGSQAGTSLRRILTEMAKTGLPAAQAFDKVAKSGISVTDAMDEVGRTAQTALLVLSKNKDGVNDLAKALDNAGGSAQKMADEQLKSLQGQLTLLSSAWDGFIINLAEGEGVFSKSLGTLVELLTQAIQGWDFLLSSAEGKSKKMNEIRFSQGAEDFNKIQESINEKYERRENLLKRIKQIESSDISGKGKESAKIAQERLDSLNLQIKQEEILLKKRIELSKADTKENQERIKKEQTIVLENIFFIQEKMKLMNDEEKADKIYGKALKGNKEKLRLLNEEMNYYNGRMDAYNKTQKKATKTIENDTVATDSNTKAKKKNVKEIKEVRFALMGSVEWFEKLKRALEEEQKQVSTNSDKWQDYQKRIDQVQKSIEAITGASKELDGLSIDINNDAYVTDEEGDRLIQIGKDFRAMLKEFKQGFIDDFADQSGFSLMLDLLSGGLEKFEGDAISTALAVSEAFQQAFNTIAQYSQENFDAEYSRLEQQKEISVQFAGESTVAKEEIERQYEVRKKAIQKREAEAQKRLAVFNAVINTAQAVVAALPNFVLSGIVAAVGAAQVALISSQTVPQFWRGTDNAPEGWALTQERGAEVITDKKGNIKTLGNDKGAQMTYLNKGDKVYKSHDDYINKVLSKNGISDMGTYLNISPKTEITNSLDMAEMRQEFSKLASVISNKEGVNISIDERGFNKRKGDKEVLNSRLTLKSRQI